MTIDNHSLLLLDFYSKKQHPILRLQKTLNDQCIWREKTYRESDIRWLKRSFKISIPYYTILIRLHTCTILNCSLKTPHIRMTSELKKGERYFCSLQRPPGSFDSIR